MATTAKNNTLTNQEKYELTLLQMERAAGGKRPKPTDGIVDFFIWAACGFHHRYVNPASCIIRRYSEIRCTEYTSGLFHNLKESLLYVFHLNHT